MTLRMTGILAGLGLMALCASAAADEVPSNRLRSTIAHYWDTQLKSRPVEATIFVGDKRDSDRVDDPSQSAFEAWLDGLRSTRSEMSTIGPADLIPANGLIARRLTLEPSTTDCSRMAQCHSGYWSV
jgi:uncharacterized protein (DUF885 family)